jgi:SagB-type dehydrogenase family enzyme
LVAAFGSPRTLAGASPDLMAVASLLLATKFLEPDGAAEPQPLLSWEFHDLLFHHGKQPRGRTERFRGNLAQPPERKPPMSDDAVVLEPPDAAKLRDTDPPLARVSDDRRSLRTPGTRPIALSQLGEFLWRVARVPRPLPAAGGLHELEFYALVDRCDGLASGLYHYYGSTHILYRLAESPAAEALIETARTACAPERHRPHVVVVVAARFARMAWSYEGIAYRNVLLDTGIALHAMYLAATAMNLAPCALGWNDPDLFATAAALDPLEESSVALFALSSRP